ncbi:MAG: hypothetical protein U5R46_16980 [Gammaproteobacteria bacterium]|nr:hypothetical protein [Gammaproteobacteria bacterium]
MDSEPVARADCWFGRINLSELEYLWVTRKLGDGERTVEAIRKSVGRRLMCRRLLSV